MMIFTIIIVFCILIAYFVIRKPIFKLRERWFASFMSSLSRMYNEASDARKQNLFASMKEIVSADSTLKNKNQIRILEIGCGSGANLKYYPSGSNLVMLDKNTSFERNLRDNLAKYPLLKLEKLVHASAEDMRGVPDESTDVVVSTCVLCSVGDIQRVLDEVRRVLVPGGKFFFMEHVVDKKGTFLYNLQQILTKTGFWPTLFCGCHLSRDIGATVKQAGFSAVSVQEYEFKNNARFVFYFVKPHICGTAIK